MSSQLEAVAAGTESAPSHREQVVAPYNGRRETLVFGLAILAVLALAALRFSTSEPAATAPELAPYQRLDDRLSVPQRTLYRTLTASIPEILALRDLEGTWPEAELLELEALPPFDRAFLPPDLGAYLWQGYDGGAWIDYHGQVGSGAGAGFILRLIDLHAAYHPHPHPGIDYDPELAVASQVWFLPAGTGGYPGERLPEAGWLWLLTPDDPVLARAARETEGVE